MVFKDIKNKKLNQREKIKGRKNGRRTKGKERKEKRREITSFIEWKTMK